MEIKNPPMAQTLEAAAPLRNFVVLQTENEKVLLNLVLAARAVKLFSANNPELRRRDIMLRDCLTQIP
jgi:hypothetical protein